MRPIGLVYVGVFVAAITAFLHGATEASPPVVAVSERSAEMPVSDPLSTAAGTYILVEEPAGKETAEAAQSQERPQERSVRSSRFRRQGRSRYRGAIPTPADWRPPEGPVRIALQAGHWRADEAPRELAGLRGNGTSWGNMPEWRTNLEIARRAGAMLEEMGYEVDILPAVVPPSYRAHLFISIHADGSGDPSASGYRVAAPRRDATGRASQVATLLKRSYGEATGLTPLPTITRRMRNYYAFNFRRYEHALHPMTIGVILETGFLTSSRDRRVIVNDPDRAARGIVEAVAAFPVTQLPGPVGGR